MTAITSMTSQSIAQQRLLNQGLATSPFTTPGDVVLRLGAVQAQEFALAKWSIAQRCAVSSESVIDRAIADGTILRTHMLRPTWHFVHRDDIRWLLELSAARVQSMIRHRHRQLGLDTAALARTIDAIAGALAGGTHLTRKELGGVLERAGIATDGQRLAHILGHAEVEAVICSGAPRGKQQTYALTHERAPDSASLPREQALGELTARYFRSRGPATIRDFQWWASLTAAEVKHGIAMLGDGLARFENDGHTYWFDPAQPRAAPELNQVQLVQEYDEYLVAYTESRMVSDIAGVLPVGQTLTRVVLLDGQVVGRWRQPAGSAQVELQLLVSPGKQHQRAIDRAVERYVGFAVTGS